MSADGTLSIGSSPAAAVGVTVRGASLPSSSTSKPQRAVDEGNSEAEGKAPAIGQEEAEAGISVTESVRAEGSQATATSANQDEAARAEDDATSRPEGLEEQLEQTREAEQERLSRFTEEINKNINERLTLRFQTDEETGRNLFQLIERESGEVVRQFPPEEVLDFIEKFQDFSGFLISEQA